MRFTDKRRRRCYLVDERMLLMRKGCRREIGGYVRSHRSLSILVSLKPGLHLKQFLTDCSASAEKYSDRNFEAPGGALANLPTAISGAGYF